MRKPPNPPPEQPPDQETSQGSFILRGLWRDAPPLLLGLALALLTGWAALPRMPHTSEAQPAAFSHMTHLEKAGLNCVSCHFLREDGSFSGRPGLENCGECHSSPLGENLAEQRLISEYIEPGREIPWFSYASQPDHVFFSHAAHSPERCNACHQFTETRLCGGCHADMSAGEELPPYSENRITGHSKDAMAMSSCVGCHALPGHASTTAANDCAVCHK